MAYIQQTQQAWATAWQKNPTRNINKVVYHLLTLPNSFKIRIDLVIHVHVKETLNKPHSIF